ncbi:hypothetical protein DCAR_0935363 [Daucus carota subsp. sativus]|uniref:SET domain-containing protein n=1 Tax=Daucus carota subsp. sativus TaxID=79200 RepID=A0A175YI27_DAUCS|nr:PREDICTED: histone-lysine N-methyltransferase ASHR2 [Daucus carota subsp. sativus]WOH15817.1 hypothetical protein DCAR_0935363 [Daucus carota subsp. sativus]
MSPAITVTEIQGRGRSVISTRPLKAGEIILKDSPILLYSAQSFVSKTPHYFCSNCFKSINSQTPSVVSCQSCLSFNQSTLFCSPECHSVALGSFHSPWVCEALRRFANPLISLYPDNLEIHLQARFLVAAFCLAVKSPEKFGALMSLQGEGLDSDEVRFLYSVVKEIRPPAEGFVVSLEVVAALLAKDKLNAFGLMEPFEEDKERAVRAYGIYLNASFFNHDCLPNACRFEYVDKNSGDDNTDMVIRMIHDVPSGREICLSYFPVNFKYVDRQKRLLEDYGFNCECDRCKVEANWSDDDEDGAGDGNGMVEEEEEWNEDEQMVEDGMAEEESDDQNNDFPHAYFFVKYMCNRNSCWGTLAPLPPQPLSDSSSDLMECSVCGNLTKDSSEFNDGI